MAAQWRRWLRYARAKVDQTVAEGEADLDRREAELEARAAGKPWLESDAEAPTIDEARARIEHDAREAERRQREREEGSAPGPGSSPGAGAPVAGAPGSTPASGAAPPSSRPEMPPPLATDPQLGTYDFAAHERAADERLAAIRAELGLSPESSASDDPEAEAEAEAQDEDGEDEDGEEDDDGRDDPPEDDVPVAPV